MRVFEFIIVITVVYGIFEYLKQRQKFQQERIKHEKVTGDLESELTNIKQRLVVLEKIVTDKGYDLKQEIDDL
ncbi:hypothetical protein [Thalassotalea sp. Y01]|uniref:hypothetical protein n=1 Tax=Thalassotalea sp. Y01 TaxID=2729613 RepID=UPI00145D7523|nr:hypothetical protein [Thalassotalea sp. Y01]NMP17696.1 hypothetical protein [Thalassotalea sp. Y01]